MRSTWAGPCTSLVAHRNLSLPFYHRWSRCFLETYSMTCLLLLFTFAFWNSRPTTVASSNQAFRTTSSPQYRTPRSLLAGDLEWAQVSEKRYSVGGPFHHRYRIHLGSVDYFVTHCIYSRLESRPLGEVCPRHEILAVNKRGPFLFFHQSPVTHPWTLLALRLLLELVVISSSLKLDFILISYVQFYTACCSSIHVNKTVIAKF
ncbi:hypothetical protein EDD18DRAFT_367117 [Armillaria luteobubalina]|uniref:Uncharacterized protein n=1 Tax=Armillaria luteobubalina TaxID=153913 RepID=A0AA39Q2S9_9AGAR|nr:hypothetical protein EDD18DRAFT_367117 [Armillaria luteobubalina]